MSKVQTARAPSITVILTGRFSARSTTARARQRTTPTGHTIAELSARQIKAAANRCCYAGADWPRATPLEGFGDWEPTESGGMSCVRVSAV